MGIAKELVVAVTSQILIIILTPVTLSISSQLTLDTPLAWLNRLNQDQIIIIVIFGIVSIIVWLVYWRYKKLHPQSGIFVGKWGWDYPHDLFEKEYAGAVWTVSSNTPFILPNTSVLVRPRPKCLKCRVELKEESKFFGGYKWRCIDCGNIIRSKRSASEVADDVERLAERDVERLSNGGTHY